MQNEANDFVLHFAFIKQRFSIELVMRVRGGYNSQATIEDFV
jgi:hypothetical protein